MADAYELKEPASERYVSTTECEPCGSPALWIILIVFLILVIIGLVIWLLYINHRNSNNKGQIIELAGANILVVSPTSITGHFTNITSSGTKVTLYATLHPPIFNSDGTLANNSVSGGKNQASVTTPASSVTVTGLTPNIKYYATLVATSTKANNYQVYTQLVYMEDTTPSGETATTKTPFRIGDILQVGNVQLASTTPNTDSTYNIEFAASPTDAQSGFYMNTRSQIQSTDTSLTDAPNGVCLFNVGGKLIAKDCGTAGDANSQWVYNAGPFANQWCLSSTTNSTTPSCMILGGISQGKYTISVGTTDVGDAWTNTLITQ